MSTVIPNPATTDWVPMGFGLGGPLPSQPAARVYQSGTPQSIPNNTWTAVSFNGGAKWDTVGMWSGANPTRLTCKVAGVYVASASIQFYGAAGGINRLAAFMVNGAGAGNWQTIGGTQLPGWTASTYGLAPITTILQLNVGDYVEVQVLQDSGAALSLNSPSPYVSEFSMALVGGVPGPPGPTTAVSYSTTLPGSPVDGQEAILVDSTTNPSYQWRFRYNAGSSSAYKWEYLGGKFFLAVVDTSESAASPLSTWYDLTTLGPDFVAPRAGEYMIECRAVPAATAAMIFGVAIPETSLPAAGGLQASGTPTSWGETFTSGWNLLTMTSGQRARVRYYQTVASTAFAQRRLTVYPARVS